LEEVLGSSCPLEVFRGKLVVDVCSVKVSVWVSQGGRCLEWISICVILGPTLIYIIYNIYIYIYIYIIAIYMCTW
jgi:hypothetical protein